MKTVKENAKAVIAFFTSLGTWGAAAMPEGIEGAEWFGLCGVVVATFSVWVVENQPTADQLERLSEWKNN